MVGSASIRMLVSGALALTSLALAACAAAPSREPAPEPDATARARSLATLGAALDAEGPPNAGPGDAGVSVRLAFGAEADLDLYVTDPSLETVYFAKRESASGGRLETDRRCDAPAPRIEVAKFPTATPGVWRVGVDHPRRCDGGKEASPFVVELVAPGIVRRGEGTIGPGEFRIVVLEVSLPPATPDAGP